MRCLPTRWRRKPDGIEITSLSPYVYALCETETRRVEWVVICGIRRKDPFVFSRIACRHIKRFKTHVYVNKTCLVAYPRKQRHDRWKVSQVLKSKMRYVRCSVHTCKTASRKRQTYGSKKSQEFMHYSCVN